MNDLAMDRARASLRALRHAAAGDSQGRACDHGEWGIGSLLVQREQLGGPPSTHRTAHSSDGGDGLGGAGRIRFQNQFLVPLGAEAS